MLCTNKAKTGCPTKKHVTLKNYHKQQEVENVIYADIESYMESMNRSLGDNMFLISKHYLVQLGLALSMTIIKTILVMIVLKVLLRTC